MAIIRNDADRLMTQNILLKVYEEHFNAHWDEGGPIRDYVANWLDQATNKQLGKAYDCFFQDWCDAAKKGFVPRNSETLWGFEFYPFGWDKIENSMNC